MRVGIVIPAYNVAPWIGDAIRSVLAQTHSDWSLVVIDDGSTDGTAARVGGFGDRRIRLIRQANGGVSSARNRGISELASDTLLFLDADDWLAPDALARLLATLRAAPYAVASVGAFGFVASDRRVAHVRRPPSGDLLCRLLRHNRFANGGQLLLHRAAVHRAGSFCPDLVFGEDWEYWIRVALLGDIVAVPDRRPVLFVRRRADSAYQRLAVDPAAFAPCMAAIFDNPELRRRLGAQKVMAMRRAAEAENAWIAGRELMRHGRTRDGRLWLWQSVVSRPSAKRAALLALACTVPGVLRGV